VFGFENDEILIRVKNDETPFDNLVKQRKKQPLKQGGK
jgi:hypothetical protein